MIKLACYLTGFSSKTDGSASLRFSTQELSAEDFGELKRSLNAYGWMVFRENEISLDDIPTEDVEDKNKTPSKRMRSVIFVLWKQKGSNGDFEVFYRNAIEKFIERVKNELD